MWKRKTEEDYKKENKEREREREREKEVIFLGLSMRDILVSLSVAIFFAFCAYVYEPDISSIIFFFVLTFVVCCIGAHLYGDTAAIFNMFGIGTNYSSLYPSVICNACHSVVQRSDIKICECGGEYEPLENWKWIEDEIEESEQTN